MFTLPRSTHLHPLPSASISRSDAVLAGWHSDAAVHPVSPALVALNSAALNLAYTALDHAHYGVILLDEHRRMHFANRHAQVILARADALVAMDDRLQFLQPRLQAEFVAHLANASADDLQVHDESEDCAAESARYVSLRVPRKTGATDYAMTIRCFVAETRTYIVHLYDYDRAGIVHDLLRRIYRLTDAEARVAFHLYRGLSVQDTARMLRIRESTARGHLTRIMTKCGVCSLSTLLQCLALGPLMP